MAKFNTQYYYDVYVITATGALAEVAIKIDNTYYKRFTPSSFNSIKLQFISSPPLQIPIIILSNDTTTQGGIVQTVSSAGSSTINYLIYFVIFMVGVLVVFIINFYRYMKYNPD